MSTGARRACAVVLLMLTAACKPGRDHAAERAVVRATLVQLFARREQARAITMWHDPRQQAPTLAAYGPPFDHRDTLALQGVDSSGLGLPFRVEHTTLLEMERFFRMHPGGWDAWLEAHPGNAGVVEVTRPRFGGDSAVVVVGRACGEICRSVWRVSLARAGSGWQVRAVTVMRVPR